MEEKLFELFSIKNDIAKDFAKFHNYDNFWKWYSSILQDKLSFLMLHNFMKLLSGTRVNEIVNKCLNG